MTRILIFIFGVFISVNTFAERPELNKKVKKELAKHYEIENISTNEISDLSNENDLFFKIYNGESNLGIAVLTSAKGRYDKFDYLLIYNTKYELELIKILVYRSDYGSEISAKRWLSQFYGKKEENLKYGSDIQAISGATFSAISLTKNINRINHILNEYIANEKK